MPLEWPLCGGKADHEACPGGLALGGADVSLIDSAQETAAELARVLHDTGLAANGRPAHRFVVSDDPARFRQVGARFIGERLGAAEVVSLG